MYLAQVQLPSTWVPGCVTRCICLWRGWSSSQLRCAGGLLRLYRGGKMGPLSKPNVEICGRGQDVIVALMIPWSRSRSMWACVFQCSPHWSSSPVWLVQLLWSILEAAFVLLEAAASFCCNPSAAIVQRLVVVAFCQVGVFVPKPRPPLPCWTWPTMFWWWRADFQTSITAAAGIHFLLVDRLGAISFNTGSWDSVRDMVTLTLAHLYSSTGLEMGSERAPLLYRPTLLRHLRSPSSFLTWELISLCRLLAWDCETLYMVIGHMSWGSSPNWRGEMVQSALMPICRCGQVVL